MINYVVGFCFTPDYKHVVLIKKNRPDWQAGRWNGVGGKMADDELWEDAMCREFYEETGVRISGWDWKCTASLGNDDYECRFFFAISPLAYQAKTMESEEVALHAVADIPNLPTVHHVQWMVPFQLDRSVATVLDLTPVP